MPVTVSRTRDFSVKSAFGAIASALFVVLCWSVVALADGSGDATAVKDDDGNAASASSKSPAASKTAPVKRPNPPVYKSEAIKEAALAVGKRAIHM